ncbi:MAG: FAD-binding oxidoreductase [Dehalococcoidia bacterium]
MSEAATAHRIGEFVAVISSSAGLQVTSGGTDAYAVDGMLPDVVVTPVSIEQLQACLSEAGTRGLAVIPFGGGAHMALGNTPAAYDVALALGRLDRIVAHEPADLTVTVEAGVRLDTLQAALAQHGQFLPLDAPGDGRATVGGVLAANAQGALRHAFGTARDWVIGIKVVQADGTLVKSGGRVVKNVAGYDMGKLYVGSLGTLGVIAEVTFKLAPLPAAEATVVAACPSPHAAATLLFAAHDAGLALHAAELLSPGAAQVVLGDARWSALFRVAGGARAVERTLRELRALAAGMQATCATCEPASVARAWHDAFAPRALSLRVSVLPSAVPGAIEEIESALGGASALLSSTVSAGLIRARVSPGDDAHGLALVDTVRVLAARCDGTLVVEAASPSVKREMDVFGPTRTDFAIMQRLKDELDRRRTLAPGRFAGRL